jgi:TadE-like protein
MRVKGLDATQTKGRRLSRLLAERGQATVEFALILPALLLLILGMLDFGKAFNYWIDETHLANEAARWAAVNVLPNPDPVCSAKPIPLGCEIKKQADTGDLKNGGGSVASPGVCITFSFPNSTGPNGAPQAGDPVKVDATATYNWLSFLSGSVLGLGASKQITGSATMRLEQDPTATVYGSGTQC